MDVADDTSIGSLEWVTSAEMQAGYLKEFLPFIPWQVNVQYLDIQNYPSWNELFWQYAEVIGGKAVVDGGQMFEAIYEQMRPQYISISDPNVNVFGVVFIKKNMEMQVYGRTYTGLGGGGQTVIWKSWERYYRPDGVTPKSGVSATQLHEAMHAMGFGHTWSNYHYVADFSYGPMGYFGSHNGTSTFDRNWAQSTYLDQMQAHLQALFEMRRQSIQSSDPPKVFLAEQEALDAFSLAQQRYGHMDWHGCYEALCTARDWTRRLTYSMSDHDPPLIRAWGMIPETFSSSNFTVWARVEDDLAGLENVSVHVLVNRTTEFVFVCAFDGGNYTAQVPDLANSDRLTLWVEAYDWGMNKAESNHILLIGESELAVSWDPVSITLVTSTILGAVVVAVLEYKRKKG